MSAAAPALSYVRTMSCAFVRLSQTAPGAFVVVSADVSESANVTLDGVPGAARATTPRSWSMLATTGRNAAAPTASAPWEDRRVPPSPAPRTELLRVRLAAPSGALGTLREFYGRTLGLPVADAPDGLGVSVGGTTLTFREAGGAERPFYHVALLVAGARFAAGERWLRARVDLLPRGGTGESTFAFPFWDAQACYWLDPAGSILELIGHADVPPSVPASAPFTPDELLGVSEVGLVVDAPAAAARALEERLGLPLWSGDLVTGNLGFVGGKAHTLIVCPPGRGWLPTGRPAEPHPVEVTLTGARAGTVELSPAPHHQTVTCIGPRRPT